MMKNIQKLMILNFIFSTANVLSMQSNLLKLRTPASHTAMLTTRNISFFECVILIPLFHMMTPSSKDIISSDEKNKKIADEIAAKNVHTDLSIKKYHAALSSHDTARHNAKMMKNFYNYTDTRKK